MNPLGTAPLAHHEPMATSSRYSTWMIAALILSAFISISRSFRNKGKLPPGPRGIPMLGNVFQVKGDSWRHTFMKWKEQYGPLVYLNLAGQNVVILNTHSAAGDLFDRRAHIYSDRPRWIVNTEILTQGLHMSFAPYGEVWRRMRRAAHEALHMGVVANYFDIQTLEGVHLAESLVQEPEHWEALLARSTSSGSLGLTYDLPPIHDSKHPAVGDINAFATRLAFGGYPGNFWVEYFPWLKLFPRSVAKWKAWAEDWFIKDSQMLEGYYNAVKKRIDLGESRPSFAASVAANQDRYGFSDREGAWVAGTIVSAGGETAAGVLAWFMLAMVLYPDIQARAQKELDDVVGRDRMPTFADKSRLPYIQAMVKEVLRWRPGNPVGLQHRSSEDDWYMGYFIPKGTVLIPNQWAMNRDPDIHGLDFDEFNPGRYLQSDGSLGPGPVDTKEEGHSSYGFGRRICVGRHLANNTLFIDIACILWTMNIKLGKDKQGRSIMPDPDKSDNEGLVVRPLPFPIATKPRFSDALTILEQTKEQRVSESQASRVQD